MVNSLISSATAIKAAEQRTQLAYALAAKQLDSQRQQGQMAVQLLAPAQKLASQSGSFSAGRHLDVYA